MEKWEYGQLFTIASADPVYVFQTASNQQVFTGYLLSTYDTLGAEGWIIDAPGPLLPNPPQWLLTSSGVDARIAGLAPRWASQFARRKVT
ncbi:hypothetical protein ACVMYR_28255 [Micromonospora sp. PTRAS2]